MFKTFIRLFEEKSFLRKYFLTFLLVIGNLFIFQILLFGQNKGNNSSISNQEIDDESNIEQIGPTSCETLLAALDLYSKQKLDENSKVIIIFRMHKKETQKHYNIRREQLSNWFERRYPKRVIYAKGDVSNDFAGRADIYINGKKVFIIKFGTRLMGVCSGDNPYWIIR